MAEENKDSIYSEQTVQRVIRHIPVIIRNFQMGMHVSVLARQQQCSPEVIEEVLRLGFKASFQVVPMQEHENPTD